MEIPFGKSLANSPIASLGYLVATLGRKTVALIGGHTFAVSRSNAGHYKSFVDINATADFVHDF